MQLTFEICGYDNDFMSEMYKKIGRNEEDWTKATNPIFAEPDHILRSYYAIAIRCDVWLKGVPNINTSNISKYIESNTFKKNGTDLQKRRDLFAR